MSALHHIANRTKTLPPLRVGIGGPVGSGKTTLLRRRAAAAFAQEITNDAYGHHGQQRKHQDVAKSLTHAQAACQPSQSQAGSQATEHGTPWAFSRRRWCRRRGGWFSRRRLARCCRFSRFTLCDIAGLLARRFAAAHATSSLCI